MKKLLVSLMLLVLAGCQTSRDPVKDQQYAATAIQHYKSCPKWPVRTSGEPWTLRARASYASQGALLRLDPLDDAAVRKSPGYDDVWRKFAIAFLSCGAVPLPRDEYEAWQIVDYDLMY